MTILDTNVVSALMQATTDTTVVSWLDRQPRTSIWTSSITVFEVQMGISILERGRRRSSLAQLFDAFLEKIDHRIAAFDHTAAGEAATLAAERRKNGRSVELRDTMIAGIVLSQHAVLATRNVAHFNDALAQLINPWQI